MKYDKTRFFIINTHFNDFCFFLVKELKTLQQDV